MTAKPVHGRRPAERRQTGRTLAQPARDGAESGFRIRGTLVAIAGGIVLALLVTAPLASDAPASAFANYGALAVIVAAVAWLARKDRGRAAAWLACSGLWLLTYWGAAHRDGVQAPILMVVLLIVIIAGLFLGTRIALFFGGLSSLAALVLVWAKANDVLPPPDEIPDLRIWAGMTAAIALAIGLIALAPRAVREAQESLRAREREHRAQERALSKQLEQAQKMEAVGRLASGVAHDFNNLLTVILGNTELVSDLGGLSDEQEELLAEITKTARNAASFTRQLLAFSRPQVSERHAVDLCVFLSGRRNLLQRTLGEDLRLEIRSSTEASTVLADPVKLDQILVNLATNARDAMPNGGTLTIAVSVEAVAEDEVPGLRAGRYSTVRVSDTGTGMDPETRERIFEPFFSTKEVGQGTGLGLPIVLRLVQELEGAIQVSSEPDRGSTFTIYLPFHEGEGAPSAEQSWMARRAVRGQDSGAPSGNIFDRTSEASPLSDQPSARFPSRRASILLVEDDADVRSMARRALEAAGHRVTALGDAATALSLRQQELQEIDLLVTDVVMPGTDGPQLADELGRRAPGLCVLFISGYAERRLFETHGLDVETVAFLSKPFTPTSLVDAVERLVR